MAEGDAVVYNNAKEQLLLKTIDFVNDVFKVALVTGYTPDIDAHTQYSDVSAFEYGSSLGYTAGGKTLGTKTVTQNNTDNRAEFDAADPVWTALGPLSPATPSHAVLYDDTTATKYLIGYWVLGTTATNGGDYTLQFAAAGILTLT